MAAEVLGLNTDYLYRSQDLPTDRYMAIEGSNGLIAAIADAHSLEAAGDKILRPLADGRLGTGRAAVSGLDCAGWQSDRWAIGADRRLATV